MWQKHGKRTAALQNNASTEQSPIHTSIRDTGPDDRRPISHRRWRSIIAAGPSIAICPIHNKIIYDGHLTNCIQSRQRPAAVPQEPPTRVGEEQPRRWPRQPTRYNIISSNTFLYYMFCLALLLMFIPHLMVLLGIWQIHEYCMLCIWFGNIMYVQSAKESDLLEPINLT